MKQTMTFWISTRIARRYGTRAAAVAGWVYAYARKAVLEAGAEDGKGRGWVRASQEQIARDLHLCRQTVAKILRTLTQEGILVAANFYTDGEGAERLCEAEPEDTRRGATASVKGTRCESAATHKGKQVGHRLGKANRGYTIGSRGWRMMRLKPRQWHVTGEEALLCCGGIDTGVASRVGVNAAIVFQYLWFWTHAWRRATPSKTNASLMICDSKSANSLHPPTADAWSTAYRWGSHYTKGGRAWLPYTAAQLARWLPFLSDDVIEDALHTLEAEGLLAKMREGRVTKWAITDAGFTAMGEECPLQMVSAYSFGEARALLLFAHSSARNAGGGNPSTSEAGVPSPCTPTFASTGNLRERSTHSASRMLEFRFAKHRRLAGTVPDTHAEDKTAEQAAIWAQAEAARQEAWEMAVARIKAVRNRRRRLRRKGLSEWSVLSL